MYKVRMESKQEGKKKTRRMESIESFASIDDANKFIDGCIEQQEKLCWQSWGMMKTEQRTENGCRIAWYRPAVILFASLTQKFEILEA